MTRPGGVCHLKWPDTSNGFMVHVVEGSRLKVQGEDMLLTLNFELLNFELLSAMHFR